MKIAELSLRSGIPVSTIKLYLRRRMLARGDHTHANQATYNIAHVRRLSLIRVLREVGGLSLDQTQRVVFALDEQAVDPLTLTGAVIDATARAAASGVGTQEEREQTYRDIDAFLAKRGWPVREGSSARRDVTDALVAIRMFVQPGLPADALEPYARAAEEMAAVDFARPAPTDGNADAALEAAVTGTILWERAFVALRRLAHERIATQRPTAPSPRNPATRSRRKPR